jgi:hypothetical protein
MTGVGRLLGVVARDLGVAGLEASGAVELRIVGREEVVRVSGGAEGLVRLDRGGGGMAMGVGVGR